ncbi:MAG: lytic murein transglycosylase B [Gammaproteobacteria bacterium]|nr:lytic murein transglycosylase B [Gammaproteobacteria bacterium]MDH5652430.1 lytic murein transglycosylase B [Gammaproteobacteria bacterium]
MRLRRLLIISSGFIALCIAGLGVTASTRPVDEKNTRDFIKEMVKQHKFDEKELEEVFSKARIHQRILDAIARPAEAKPWHEYRPIFLNEPRIQGGIKFWNENALLLKKASEKYGVPPEIIVAIIGVETRYGQHKGRYPVIDSLSTLAFAYPPRSSFFRSELKQFLLMAREEKLDPTSQMGSYAGAMGMPQFISSSFRRYAVDFDGDGSRDLWDNNADVIGSVANYFKRHGWQKDEPITDRVTVQGKGYRKLLSYDLEPQWTPKQLHKHGIKLPVKRQKSEKGTLIKLDTGTKQPEFWVGWQNFYVITRYNHSAHYSMAVYQLGEEIRQQR